MRHQSLGSNIYLKSSDIATLKNEANSATAARLIDGHARVRLAEQNAPAVIAFTGNYPDEEEPAAQDFVSTYGATDGQTRFDEFRATVDAANSFHNFYRASNREIHAELRFRTRPEGYARRAQTLRHKGRRGRDDHGRPPRRSRGLCHPTVPRRSSGLEQGFNATGFPESGDLGQGRSRADGLRHETPAALGCS
ncbi:MULTISPECIES: hypothetical protein [unclassified Mesorhizobium]|uniref:hypothetical protein n=1 Tax=unclassified Mesorhizobium TaxID=325217 RepID=UPI0012DCE590|nr:MULTISPECIES: hypothetical protein [unclassified Mesorhizobium]